MTSIDNQEPSSWFSELCDLGMIIGGALAIEHYITNGRWTDEEKDECHGKIGLGLFFVSFLGRLLSKP